PVSRRQPAHVHALKRWHQHRVNYLQQAGQAEEALRLLKQLATDYPRDSSLQQQYGQALVNGGDYDAAYAWMKKALAADHWQPNEEESLRNTHAHWLQNQGQYLELVDSTADWLKRNPENYTAYAMHLSALVRTNQVEKADALIARWLREARAADELS